MITRYLKTVLTPEMKDVLRINLSANRSKLSHDPVCDFCGNPDPIYVYRATRFTTGEECENWRWCACPVCSMLVDSNEWDDLKERIKFQLRSMMFGRVVPEHVLNQAVEVSFRAFFRDAVELKEGE